MATRMETRPRARFEPMEWHGVDVGTPTVRNPAFDAFWLLRIGFGIAPILFGIDKFFYWMTDWDKYLWPEVARWFSATPGQIMDVIGVVEICAGLLVLFAPRIGSLLVAAWLGAIVTNLVAYGIDEGDKYWDIALRDFGLMIGAVALFLLANAYAHSHLHRRHDVSTADSGTRSTPPTRRPAGRGSTESNYSPSSS